MKKLKDVLTTVTSGVVNLFLPVKKFLSVTSNLVLTGIALAVLLSLIVFLLFSILLRMLGF